MILSLLCGHECLDIDNLINYFADFVDSMNSTRPAQSKGAVKSTKTVPVGSGEHTSLKHGMARPTAVSFSSVLHASSCYWSFAFIFGSSNAEG